MNEPNGILGVSQRFMMARLIPRGVVECIHADAMRDAARVLAEAYLADPLFLWAMPKANSRLADATAFFTFSLRRAGRYGRRVFTNTDHSAVAVLASIVLTDTGNADGRGHLPAVGLTTSPVGRYFTWIESHRPDVDHQYLEFIGCMSAHRSKGKGSFLLGALLEMFAEQGLPVWSWSSNPCNLTFYRRLGFEIGHEVRQDGDTPAVTPLWYPTVPLAPGLRLRSNP